MPAESTSTVQQPSRTWKLDFERGRVTGMIDDEQAIQQAVIKALQTERFSHLIYSFDYGAELEPLVGKSAGLLQSEIKRRIREALLQDDRISDVTDFAIDMSGDSAKVRFTVISSIGTVQGEVTIDV